MKGRHHSNDGKGIWRLHFPKTQTLMLKRPLGRIAALSVFTGLITLAIVEMLLRVPTIQAALPVPTYGTRNIEFAIKVAQLDELVARRGSVDCIFLGSSVMEANGDAVAFAEGYQKSRDKEIVCYNFGIGGLAPVSAGRVARFLAARYRPQIIIYSVSALEFTDGFNLRSLPAYETPWIRYVTGEISVEGWLFDTSRISQYLFNLNVYTDFEYHNLYRGFIESINDYGLYPRRGVYEYKPDEPVLIPEFKLSQYGVTGLDEFLGFQKSSGTQLIVVEEPVYPDYFQNNYLGGGKKTYSETFLNPIRNQTRAEGVIFMETLSLTNIIPQNGWDDKFHLNETGAAIFSEWLGEQVGGLVAQGQLKEIGR